MDHEVADYITVKVDGREYDVSDVMWDREAEAASYGEIYGPCSAHLPKPLLYRIEAAVDEVARRQEQERLQEAAESREDR